MQGTYLVLLGILEELADVVASQHAGLRCMSVTRAIGKWGEHTGTMSRMPIVVEMERRME